MVGEKNDIRDGEALPKGTKSGTVDQGKSAHMESHVHNHVHNHVHHHGKGPDTKPGNGEPTQVKKSPSSKMYDKKSEQRPMDANDGM